MNYKKVLIGTDPFFQSWTVDIMKLKNKPNIIVDSFYDGNIDILEKEVDYIIPISLKEYKISQKFGKKVLFPSLKTFDIFNDKVMFVQFMINNFPDNIPETYVLNKKEIKCPLQKNGYFISKPRVSASGAGIKLYNDYNKINIKNAHIIQKYVNSEYEYSGFFFILNKKIVNWKILKQKYPDNHIKKHRFTDDCEIVENFDLSLFNNIFFSVGYVGAANVDFKIENNIIKIFEINPRFGGSALSRGFIYDLICFEE